MSLLTFLRLHPGGFEKNCRKPANLPDLEVRLNGTLNCSFGELLDGTAVP